MEVMNDLVTMTKGPLADESDDLVKQHNDYKVIWPMGVMIVSSNTMTA